MAPQTKFIRLSPAIIKILMTTARTGITGPNGTRKVTFLSGYIFLSLMAAKAVGMYWKKRKTTLKVANVSKEPDNKSKKAKIPEMIMAMTGAFLEFVFQALLARVFQLLMRHQNEGP